MSEKLKLELNVTRNETTFAATLFVDRIDNENGLHLCFVTDPDVYFDTDIHPRHFATVAQMMMEAAPEAAIRAFGKAMETAKTFST